AAESTMLVMPSDHLIEPVEDFIATLENIISSLDNHPESLYTIGIKPTFPSTAYGYIKCGAATENPGILQGESFVEKPALQLAQNFVAAGNYFWNGGMFIWRTGALMAAFEKYSTELAELAGLAFRADAEGTMLQFMSEKYPSAPSISIDYAIMEKVGRFMVASGDFGWDDIGSWSALGHHLSKDENNNAIRGNFVGTNVHDCVIYNDDPEHLL
ncbi:MAG: sugar phosphate nucleotidyltransferase, partial [Victivallaceae bacterium]